MPISDEIIELEPVKKSKSKLIILFIAVGVLLALAVTFLVLYILKPSVEENTGRVNGVSAEVSALFVDDEKHIAAVGNEYTVYVDVSAEGTADPGVNWTWEPREAITEVAHGAVGAVETDVAEDGTAATATRFYFTFNPTAKCADGITPVTITARSMSDVNKRAEILFYIVNQATEEIAIQKISHDTGAYTDIKYNDDGEISLPYYRTNKNNKVYTISFKQLGKYNPTTGKYSDLTRNPNGIGGQPTYKVDIETDKANSVISELRVVESTVGNESFRFRLCGTGTATITLTANNYNDFGEPCVKTVKIKAESTEALGYIDDIRIYDKPVDDKDGKFYKEYKDKQYTADNYGAIPASSATFTMPYGFIGYSNFLQHIVILPLSIQYNDDGTRKEDWSSHIDVKSSLPDLVAMSYDARKNVVLQTKLTYGDKNTCTLSVSSVDKLGVIVTSAINVKVVAQNQNVSISVKKDGSSVNEDISKPISTSQGSSLGISLEYSLRAPSSVDIESFVTAGYLSKGYNVSIVKTDTGALVRDFSLKLGTKEIEWGKDLNLDSMVVVKKGGEDSTDYTGTVTFKLTIPNDLNKIPDGDYEFTFTKLGTPSLIDVAGTTADLDPTISHKVKLSIHNKAQTAKFISESDGTVLAKLGGNSGKFKIQDAHKARLYLQNRDGALPDGFDFKKFVEVTDGDATINVTCSAVTASLATVGAVGDQSFTFRGNKTWNDGSVQGTVKITAKNNAGDNIGDFEIEVFLIDAIKSISVESSGKTNYDYDKNDIKNGNVSFELHNILNTFTFLQTADIASSTDKKNNAAARKNFELRSKIDSSDLSKYEPFTAVKSGNNILFKYPDANGTTVFEYNGDTESISPKVDLFEFSYNNKIDVTTVQIKYFTVPDTNFETETDIKSCAQVITFTRKADDVALFVSDAYSDDAKIDRDDNVFTYKINVGAHGSVYSSAVVNIVKTGGAAAEPVVVRYEAKQSGMSFVGNLNVEAVYFDNPFGDNTFGTVEYNGEKYGNAEHEGYYNITFYATDIDDAESKSRVVHVHNGNSSTRTLTVVVLNMARPIKVIKFYTDEKLDSELTRLDFFADASSDWSKKVFYIKATFESFDDEKQNSLYTKLEPVIVDLHGNKFKFKANEVNYGTDRVELVAPNTVAGTYYYIWKCELSLADDAVAVAGSSFSAEDKSAPDNDSSQHITATVPVTVATGVKSIKFTVNNEVDHTVSPGGNSDVDVTFVFKSADDGGSDKKINIDIPIEITAYSADKFGGIKYDTSKLSYAFDTVDGLRGYKKSDGKLTLEIDSEKAKVMNGKYVFKLTDTASGEGAVFTLTVNVTVLADIYSISIEHDGSYIVETTGADSGETTFNGKLVYNNDTTTRVPDGTYKNKVEIKVVKGGKDSVVYVDDGSVRLSSFDKESGEFTVAVNNNVLNGKYSLRVAYSSDYNNITEYIGIDVKTKSNTIKWLSSAEGNENIDNGRAEIKVKTKADKFSFVAGVYNRGDDNRVDSETSKITYAVYDSADNRSSNGERSAAAVIESDGNLRMTNPSAALGTLYVRASYVDESSGKTVNIDVDVTYKILITVFTVVGVDENTYRDETFTLYYLNNSAYTTLDLTSKVNAAVATEFGIQPNTTPTIAFAPDGTVTFAVEGNKLVPKKAGSAKLTVTADDGLEKQTHTYTVNIIGIDALNLVSGSGKIDIVKNETATVSRIVSDEKYDGLVGLFSVSASPNDVSKITVDSPIDNKSATVKLNRSAFGADDYKKYTLTATVSYSLKGGSSLALVGEFIVSADYTLTVDGEHTVSFDLYKNDSKIDEKSVNEIDDGATYKVVVQEPSGEWYVSSDFTYSASDGNGIVEIGAFTGKEGVLAFDNTKAGVISVTVTATAYGKAYRSSAKTYTFSYGGNFTTKLQSSSGGSAAFGDFADKEAASKSIAIDHDGSTKKVIRYVIDVSSVGSSVALGDVDIIYVGTATAGDVVYDDAKKQFYRDFTLDKETTLILSGSFAVSGRTYVTDKYTVQCTATAPDFALNSTKTELKAADKNKFETATLSVANSASAFKGSFDTVYSIVDGDDRASVGSSNGVLTPNAANNSATGAVVVRAAVTVTSGVFAGTTYTVDKVITIVGVALPNLTPKSDIVKADIGEVTLSDKFDFGVGAPFAYDKTIKYTVTDDGELERNVDYALDESSGRLTIHDTNKTKAGGKIKVQISATVDSAINKGKTVTAVIDIVITPCAHQSAEQTNVSGAVGSYDIKKAVAPYTFDMTGFVNASDEYKVVYTLSSEEDGISVGGDRLVISKAVTVKKAIKLKAELTFVSGAYSGTTIAVSDVTVNICGFTFDKAAVDWQSDTEPHGYEKVEVHKLLSALSDEISGEVTSITVTFSSNGAFASIAGNGGKTVTISVDKDFNIAKPGSEKKITYYASVVVGECVYYGEGEIDVKPVAPELGATINGEDHADDGSYSVYVGDSFNIGFEEKHGFNIDSVSVGDIGGGLTCVAGGANYMFTATAEGEERDVKFTVNVGGVEITHTVKIKVEAKPTVSPFTATNTSISLFFKYDGGEGTSISVLTPTAGYSETKPRQLTVSVSSGWLKQYVKSIIVSGYKTDGSSAELANYSIGSYVRTANITLSSGGNFAWYKIEFKFDVANRSNFTMNTTFSWDKVDGMSGMATSYSVNYNVSKADTGGTVDVIYESNGGTAVEKQQWNSYTPLTEPSAPTKRGYTFAGWYTVPNPDPSKDDVHKYAFGSTIDSSMTLYAGWNKQKYTVTYNGNGGTISGSSTTQTMEQRYGEKYSGLPSAGVMNRVGYDFAGWRTEKDGGTAVTESTLCAKDSDHSLYAHWTAKSYTVTFNANNGTLDALSTSKTVVYDDTYGTLPTPTRVGYVFEAWHLSSVSGAVVTSGSQVATAYNHALVASWKPKTNIAVTFNANGGKFTGGATTVVNQTYDAKYSLPTNPTRDGYTFAGWTNADGSAVAASTTVTNASNHTLYAKWTAKSVSIKLNKGSSTESITRAFGDAYALPIPTRTGYTFKYWYKQGDVDTKQFSNTTVGSEALVSGGLTLVAKWEANTYYVFLNYNDGTDKIESKEVTFGAKYSLGTPSRAGYTFGGWYATIGGSKVKIDDMTVGEEALKGLIITAEWTRG